MTDPTEKKQKHQMDAEIRAHVAIDRMLDKLQLDDAAKARVLDACNRRYSERRAGITLLPAKSVSNGAVQRD